MTSRVMPHFPSPSLFLCVPSQAHTLDWLAHTLLRTIGTLYSCRLKHYYCGIFSGELGILLLACPVYRHFSYSAYSFDFPCPNADELSVLS